MRKNKIHTFYLTESQRNNTAYLLGVAVSKLKEENYASRDGPYAGALDWMITDAETLEAVFELRHPGGTQGSLRADGGE